MFPFCIYIVIYFSVQSLDTTFQPLNYAYMCTLNIFYATCVDMVNEIKWALLGIYVWAFLQGFFFNLFKWESVCLFNKPLFPRIIICVCFQDPVEHTQEVQNEPFSLKISGIFFSLLQMLLVKGELVYCFTHFVESEFYNVFYFNFSGLQLKISKLKKERCL